MGKFDGIAILTDLDKTFFADGTRVVQKNVDAVEYFKSEGGIFTLSTGRLHFNLDYIIPDLDKLVNAPALMCNGTYFYDFAEKKICEETFIDADLAYRTVQFVHNLNMVSVIRGSAKSGYVVDDDDGIAARALRKFNINAIISAPYDRWNTEGFYKLSFIDEADTLVELEKILRKEFGEVYEYNRSSPTQLELQEKGVNKARLVSLFRKMYEKQGEKLSIYACGDNENDIAMLKSADFAICPSNAIDEVKAICDKCLCSNNDGVIADLIYSL